MTLFDEKLDLIDTTVPFFKWLVKLFYLVFMIFSIRFWKCYKSSIAFNMKTMMMMMMNCFCGMVNQRDALSLISSQVHCQISSSSRTSGTPRAGHKPAQNLSSDLVEGRCAVVITITPQSHN